MSPFKQNLERFLVFFFTAVSIVLVVMGVMRSKSGAPSAVPAPGQENPPVNPSASSVPQGASNFTGKTYQTPWGNAVASISVANGKIVGVTMPQVPNSPPSQYAEPYLIQQALATGSANIQGVSGATYTSLAFKSSLESALAQAKAQGQTITGGTTGTSTVVPKPTIPRTYRDDEGGEVEFNKWFQ